MISSCKRLFFSLFFGLLLVSCSPLLAPSIVRNSSLDGFKYFYITPTTEMTTVSGAAYGSAYGVFGSTSSKSVNPTDVICGHFLKRGFVQLLEIKPELRDKTIIVNFGESGRRKTGGLSYALEVTIQLLSAQDNSILCVATAEGRGKTETDDIRIALNRCMGVIFE